MPGGLGVAEGGHQVGQGFTRTRARLHREVTLLLQRRGDRCGHAYLAVAPGAAEGVDGGGEKLLRGLVQGLLVTHARQSSRPRMRYWEKPTKRVGTAGSSRVNARPSHGRVVMAWAR